MQIYVILYWYLKNTCIFACMNRQNLLSILEQEASACLHTGGPKEICPLGLTPTTSTTVMTVIGDLLVVSVMNRINFGSADYAKRHHGGYLGAISRQQSNE